MCKCNEDFELLSQALGQATRSEQIPARTIELLKALTAKPGAIIEAFPSLAEGMVAHVRALTGESGGKALNEAGRAVALAAIKERTECNCVAKPSADFETQMKCWLQNTAMEAAAGTGGEGMCAIEDLMKKAQRVAAQRKYLRGLYDLYLNAALASGLPDTALPSPVGGSGSGGQEGENGGGRPSAP